MQGYRSQSPSHRRQLDLMKGTWTWSSERSWADFPSWLRYLRVVQHWGQSIECLSSHYMFLFTLCCFLHLFLMCAPVYVYIRCPPASVEKLHLPFYHFCLVSGCGFLGLFRQRQPSKHAVCCEPTRCELRHGDRPFRNLSLWRELGLLGRPSALAGPTLHLLPSPGLCHPPEHREPEKNRMPRDFPWAEKRW